MSAAVEVYWLPYCSTCQKAVGYLRERGAEISGYRDLKANPLSEDEVRELAAKVGGVETLFSRRAMKFRQMGLHERTLDDDEMVRLMAQEYTFVTRPVVVRDERAAAGFSARRIDALIG
jgi:arsenate reductase (glutaredoxin)